LNALPKSYESFIQTITSTHTTLSFEILVGRLQHEENQRSLGYNMKSSKNVFFIRYKKGIMHKPNNVRCKLDIYFYCGKFHHFFNECKETIAKSGSKINTNVV